MDRSSTSEFGYHSPENFRRSIFKYFLEICKLMNKFPSNYQEDRPLLQSINEELTIYLRDETTSTKTDLGFICDGCDQSIEIVNNDVEYSVQLHHQDAEHNDIVKSFLEVAGKKSSDSSESASNVSSPSNYFMKGGYVYCKVCDTFLYDISMSHLACEKHEENLTRLPISLAEWKIIDDQFLFCTVCSIRIDLLSHSLDKLHMENITCYKWKTATMKKLEMMQQWEDAPDEAFNELLIRVRAKNIVYCDACDLVVDDLKYHLHNAEHRCCLLMMKEGNILSDSFGIVEKINMLYCVLCHVGLTNIVEYQWHVYGKSSTHNCRLTAFRKKIFAYDDCSKEVNLLFQTNNESRYRSYSLDVPLSTLLENEVTGDMKEFVFVYMDDIGVCTICDKLVSSYSVHAASIKHKTLLNKFKICLEKANLMWGIVEKKELFYCVICHAAFPNAYALYWHSESPSLHSDRLNYYKVLKRNSDACSLNGSSKRFKITID